MSERIDVCVKCWKTRDNHVLGDECNFPIFLPMEVGGEVRNERRPFFQRATEIGMLAEEKSAAYGDAAAKYEAFLLLLWPNGIRPAAYRDAGLALRVFDKLKRIATNNDPLGENPWDDIAGYGVIASAGKRQ